MKLSTWRPSIQKFITDRLYIDSWLLERPEYYGQLVGFLPPLRDIDYRREDFSRIVVTATQDFIVSQRLPSELSFKDLPLASIEGNYNTLAIAFLVAFEDIDTDVQALRFNQVEQPIAVAEVAEDANDWIVDIKYSIRVEIEVEPELGGGGIVEPFDLTAINTGVWRDQLNDDTRAGTSDITKRHLDFRVSIDKTSVVVQ